MSDKNIFDTKDGYIDLKGMQERVDKKNAEQAEQVRKNWESIRVKAEKKRRDSTQLFMKALKSEREENEKKRAIEIEAEKEKAIAEVEAKYESKGVKSEHTKQMDNAYRSLLDGLGLTKK
ncbi:hypothetical protein ACWN8V_07775 [Vagococcus elongatus]|uniref:Uncharacterized protein n=1 Tax=Vagococcus elongatus TaxID=180344 RepID=A0A430AU15_9ENTE|nr:hypothetical protein [Vagococcus elongatus]RSU11545.1 hypothetical protein CBF29_07635 [Vagococcus elongatus]